MDVVDLLKYINSDLTWTVKKGHRTRRPKRPGASDKVKDAVVTDYEKSGVAILGQHFAEAPVVDVPIKKRILLLESPSPSGEHARSPTSHLASPQRKDSEMLASSRSEKKPINLNDFSGIELLADAACHDTVYDNSGHVETMEVEVLTTPIVVSNTDCIEDDTTPMDSEDLSVQDNTVPVAQDICDDVTVDNYPVSMKPVRFHWDLNALPVDDWVDEEPSCDILIDPQPVKSCIEDITITSQLMPSSKPEALNTQDVCLRDVLGTIKGKISDAESFDISNSDLVNSSIHPTKCEKVSTSTDSVSQEQTTVRVEPIIKSDEGQSVSEELQGGCLSLKGYDDKPTLEDRVSEFCGSNASEDEHAEGNTIDKVKAGYESPVEDGELRDPDRFPWQDEEVEERECVDYESDNIYEDNYDAMETSENEISLDQHHQNIAAVGAEKINDFEHDDRVNHRMSNLQAHSESAFIDKDGKYISERKMVYNESGDRIPSLDRSTSSFGVRKAGVNGAYLRQGRYDDTGNTYSRDRRDFGPKKFIRRDRPSYQRRTPNDAGGQWGDSFSRNSHGYPRPENAICGSNSVENKEPISYNPRANYRTFNTGDRNESYSSFHRGPPPPARSISRDGFRRAPPQEYKAPGSCYTERKVPSFSSNFSQSGHISRSRKRSRSISRSRSGSPIAWHFQKKGNLDTKEQSPDYRPDTRLPLRKPSEIDTRHGPPTRCHVSPQRVPRSFDDRNVIDGQHRDRRSSPVRTFHQDQRFEASGHPGRLMSNDHFRPTPQPERFLANREKFAANSDDKYGMMNRGRPFRNDKNDYIKDRNKVNGFRYTPNEDRPFRDPVRRDIPKNTSEENGCRYTANKMFIAEKGDFHKDN